MKEEEDWLSECCGKLEKVNVTNFFHFEFVVKHADFHSPFINQVDHILSAIVKQ